MNIKKITYQIIPFLVVGFMQFLTYWGNQWYSEVHNVIGVDYSFIFQTLNDWIPFVPSTIYIYVFAYPFWIFSFFYIGYRSKENMYYILLLVLFTFTIAGLTYFFFQSDVQSWRETSELFGQTDLNFTEQLVMNIYNAAGPRNAMPSMHTIMSYLVIMGVRMDKKMPKGMKIFFLVIGWGIIISTQTLKQHYIIDAITGIALVEFFYWILKPTNWSNKLQVFFTGINQKLRLE